MAEEEECQNSLSQEIEEVREEISKVVIEEMKCSSCEDYCHPPIKQCTDGHLNCSNCLTKEDSTCKLCRAPTSRKNVEHVEQLHALLSFPCKYKKYGCTFETIGIAILQHQKECIFFRTNCPNSGCNWVGSPGDIVNHYKDSHFTAVMEYHPDFRLANEILVKNPVVFITHFINWYGRSLLVMITVDPERNVVAIVATNFEIFREVVELELSIEFILNDKSRWTIFPKFEFSYNNQKIGFTPLQMFSFDLIEQIGRSSKDIPYDYILRINKKKMDVVDPDNENHSESNIDPL